MQNLVESNNRMSIKIFDFFCFQFAN